MINVGIVGTSAKVNTLVDTLNELPGVNPVGCYIGGDVKLNDQHKSLLVTSPNELIRSSDAVVVSSPHYSFDIAQSVLRSAKHLFLDVPFEVNVEQAGKLKNLAHEANVQFQIGLSERLNPAFIAARAYIQKPMFIEVHRLMPFDAHSAEGSIIMNHMIHDLDIVLHLVNSNVKKLSASGVSVVTSDHDMANVRLEFDNGCVVNLTASRISRQQMSKIRVFGYNSYVAIDFAKNSYEVVQHNRQNGRLTPIELQQLLSGKVNDHVSVFENSLAESNRVKTELELFLQSIKGNTRPVVSVSDAYQAMYVAQLILEKISKNALD